MQTDSAWLPLQLETVIILLATWGRIKIRKHVHHLELRLFLMELLATWQLCACSGVLHRMMDAEPKPHFFLTHMYSFHALHFYLTGDENTCNPAWVLPYVLRKELSVSLGLLTIATQFFGAFLAALVLAACSSPPQPDDCSMDIQTVFHTAFLAELVLSAVSQLAVMHTRSQELRVRANTLAAIVTALAYAGAHLTGAIFNPALAFSLHLNCFLDKFWNYILVYWIAPCVGSVLVAVLWDEVLPQIRRHFNI